MNIKYSLLQNVICTYFLKLQIFQYLYLNRPIKLYNLSQVREMSKSHGMPYNKVVKMEYQSAPKMLKKVFCPQHGFKLIYKCEQKSCKSPYICSKMECIDQHFHSGKARFSKFQSDLLIRKIQKLDKCLDQSTLSQAAQQIRAFVNGLKNQVSNIFLDLKTFGSITQQAKRQDNLGITQNNLEKIDKALNLHDSIEKRLEKLKEKVSITEKAPQNSRNNAQQIAEINVETDFAENGYAENVQKEVVQPPASNSSSSVASQNHAIQKGAQLTKIATIEQQTQPIHPVSFRMDPQVSSYLKQNIPGFTLTGAQIYYSTNRKKSISYAAFHQMLENRQNLLFIFEGQKLVIGSYFKKKYPSLAVKNLKDFDSFIFIAEKGIKYDFSKYDPEKDSTNHLSISDKLYICQGNTLSYGDGIRTQSKDFDILDYNLPSRTYTANNLFCKDYNGTMKIKNAVIFSFFPTSGTNGSK